MSRLRHRSLLDSAVQELLAYEASAFRLEFAAEHVRAALRHVGEVSGKRVATEDVLGLLMSEFCIGK
jgi:tRNA U34 5-carboxymethylaminomethyl modifying GTPase MnmE/TrmE